MLDLIKDIMLDFLKLALGISIIILLPCASATLTSLYVYMSAEQSALEELNFPSWYMSPSEYSDKKKLVKNLKISFICILLITLAVPTVAAVNRDIISAEYFMVIVTVIYFIASLVLYGVATDGDTGPIKTRVREKTVKSAKTMVIIISVLLIALFGTKIIRYRLKIYKRKQIEQEKNSIADIAEEMSNAMTNIRHKFYKDEDRKRNLEYTTGTRSGGLMGERTYTEIRLTDEAFDSLSKELKDAQNRYLKILKKEDIELIKKYHPHLLHTPQPKYISSSLINQLRNEK